MSGLTIDAFAGPGGWDTAARRLGIPRVVGLELDAAACQTRTAAGHATVRADVSVFPTDHLEGVTGFIGSPPCIVFSSAGKRAGIQLLAELEGLIWDLCAGRKTRAERRRAMAHALRRVMWPSGKFTRAERSARIWAAVRSASLVAEPARFIHACRPEWIALEQVREVLPLWQAYEPELARLGYSTWTGVLNSADYGVPQTRQRAILIASRVRRVRRPEPTHYDARRGMQLWGTPWVSMAEALGWGATGRPVPTVTAGGVALGGYEPFAKGGREALGREQEAGRWVLHTNRDQKPDGTRQTVDPATAPAPALTAKSGGQWVVRAFRNNNNNACIRSLDEPAGTLFFGHRSNWAAWVTERPATTVQGDPRIGRPGHKDRDKGESQFAQDSIRISVQEAAILQSFPADYPWRGTKTKQYEQCGNAWCPLAAIPVLGMATGIDWQPVAEEYIRVVYGRREVA